MLSVSELSLRNFRGFARLDALRLAPLTFLVGPNSSGKSSIADALLFLAQSGFLGLSGTNPTWMGQLVDLGSFKDTIYRHETGLGMVIRAVFDLSPGGASQLRQRPTSTAELSVQLGTAREEPEGRVKRLSLRESLEGRTVDIVRRRGRHESFTVSVDGESIDASLAMTSGYWAAVWQAVRPLDARRKWPILLDAISKVRDIGVTVQRVSSGRNPPRRTYPREAASLATRRRPLLDCIDLVTLEQSHAYPESVVDGLLALGIASDLSAKRTGDYHTKVELTDSRTGVRSNLADFGYGTSQVLPVLEGCARRGPGPLFVEQPEIHLHPRAQGEVAQILCDASRHRQMIVETHSEHMVNRARLLVAKRKMRPSDVIIHYIDRDAVGSQVTTIELDRAGDFKQDWPDGFYDERYNETMRIAEAQAKRRGK